MIPLSLSKSNVSFTELMIGFVQTAYTVDEDENIVAVCAEVEGANGNCLANFPFDIGFETMRGSAGERVLHVVHERLLETLIPSQLKMMTLFLYLVLSYTLGHVRMSSVLWWK